MPPRPRTVMVKREGPRGFRLINEADFDPMVHELYAPDGEAAPQEAPRRRGRPRKHDTHVDTQSQES